MAELAVEGRRLLRLADVVSELALKDGAPGSVKVIFIVPFARVYGSETNVIWLVMLVLPIGAEAARSIS